MGQRPTWVACLFGALTATATWGGVFPVVGPQDFERAGGRPEVFSERFTVRDPGAPHTLRVTNGGGDGRYARISSAVVTLNGEEILAPRDWSQQVTVIERPLALAAENVLTIELRSRGGITIEIVGIDEVAPSLTARPDPPPNAAGWNHSAVTVHFECADTTSGIALCPEPVTVTTDGADQVVSAVASDRAGNETVVAVPVSIDRRAPALAILAPTAGARLFEAELGVSGEATDELSGVAEVDCNASPAGVTDDRFDCEVTLVPGANTLTVEALDRAGNAGSARLTVDFVPDREPPELVLRSPSEPLVINDRTPALVVEYSDPSGVDPSSVEITLDGASLEVGCTVEATEARCEAPELVPGLHRLGATVADRWGNRATFDFDFTLSLKLDISIDEPAPGRLTRDDHVRVAGEVDPAAVAVRVNGMPAELADGAFTLVEFPLHEGTNTIAAVAQDAHGTVGVDSVEVTVDTTPPQVRITSPADGTSTSEPSLTVTGLVNDLTVGTINGTEVTVNVNGIAAEVTHRSFLARRVPLAPGTQRVEAVAVDRAGNSRSHHIEVLREELSGGAIRKLAGDGQIAPILTRLPEPLVVEVIDAAGRPVGDTRVIFRVVQGNGTLENGQRVVLVTTDAQGRAQAAYRLGDRSGVGVNQVRVTPVGHPGEVVFSARATNGAPVSIHVASGTDQSGLVGERLARPLVAVVMDGGHNPIAGVAVVFEVTQGGGRVAGGGRAVAISDGSGMSAAVFTLGPHAGFDRHLVAARFEGLTKEPAVFKASAFVAGDPATTRVSGVVLDNQAEPVPGVTMRIDGTDLATASDDQGRFVLEGVPVGHVMLSVDASTAARPGTWASLHFEMLTLAGIDNTLEKPIYILPLAQDSSRLVGGGEDVTLTVPEIPGLELTVLAGSTTFPDGSRTGVVSVTPVHADKIPMSPEAGMQPRVIVTIQPAGTRFDPPAAIAFPNVDGLAPGTVTEMFSFDHDIGDFVSIGTGTVSGDGLVVRSDPGFGVVKAGWHCSAQTSPDGSSANLTVRFRQQSPLPVCLNTRFTVTAEGRPPRDAAYGWEIDDPEILGFTPAANAPPPIDLDRICRGTAPVAACPDAAACSQDVMAKKPGTAHLRVALGCCTTRTLSPVAELEVRVIETDLDVDSKNTQGFGLPANDPVVDELENDSPLPGKIVFTNDNDDDDDGIRDDLDGFNRDPAKVEDDENPGERFVPLVLRLPEVFDPATATIEVDYRASPPSEPVKKRTGFFRIWTVPGNQRRNGTDVKGGGDFLAPGVYDARELGLGGAGEVTWYIEGIKPTEKGADRLITVDIDPDGGGPLRLCKDMLKITVVKPSLRADRFYERVGDPETPEPGRPWNLVGVRGQPGDEVGITVTIEPDTPAIRQVLPWAGRTIRVPIDQAVRQEVVVDLGDYDQDRKIHVWPTWVELEFHNTDGDHLDSRNDAKTNTFCPRTGFELGLPAACEVVPKRLATCNQMEIQGEVLPVAVTKLEGVQFDFKRTKEVKTWVKYSATDPWQTDCTKPAACGTGDDDFKNTDEDLHDQNGFIWVIDTVCHGGIGPQGGFAARDATFFEVVHLILNATIRNDTTPLADPNRIVSDPMGWHGQLRLKIRTRYDPDWLVRDTSGSNAIEEGTITIGAQPQP